MNDKKLEKAINKIGPTTKEEMDAMDDAALKKVVLEAESAMHEAEALLDANEIYQGLKERVKELGSAKRDTDARQKARIAYAFHRIAELGQDIVETSAAESALERIKAGQE